MKLFIATFLITFSFNGLANCYESLTQNYSRDSFAYQLNEDEVDLELDRGSVPFARAAVAALEAKLSCGMDAKALSLGQSANCQDVVPGVALSRVCYIEKPYGYFLVSVDMLENINIVFNRFD
tara:strand:- start:53266 stop:53634 length:369 start_codon:yes stop_codon:yes gene_type:complete